jgi:hypothetical protein
MQPDHGSMWRYPTASLSPKCPYIRDDVLSLYQAEVLPTGTHVNGGGQKVLFPKEHNKVG